MNEERDRENAVQEFSLRQYKYGCSQMITAEELMAGGEFTKEDIPTFVYDAIMFRFCRNFLGESVGIYQHPATWWEAFKEHFFPAWALKRWPVRNKVIEARVLYPNISLPRDKHVHTFVEVESEGEYNSV